MSNTRELTVPDIGDFTDVPIIEIFVKTGDAVGKDAPLVTLESDKATLDVPVEIPGTISEVKVKVGDRVSKGSVLAVVTVAETAAVAAVAGSGSAASAALPGPATAPAAGGAANGAANVSGAAQTVQNIVVPDIGDFKDVPVIEIFVKVGDTIEKDAPLMTLESEKATLDIPAPFSGVIKELKVSVGSKVEAGALLATATTASATQAAAPVAQTAAVPQASASPASGGPVPTPVPTVSAVHGAPPAVKSSNLASYGASNGSSSNGSSNGAANLAAVGPVHASPSIRRFARELGVELARVRGTGPNGRITRDDVQNWVKTALANPAPTAAAGAANGGMAVLAWPKVDFASFGPVERITLSRIKKLSGPNLHRNWVMIPHVTQHDEADITDLEVMRKSINGEQDVKVTMLAFLIVAAVAALKRFPDVNSSLDGDELVQKKYYNIGFAADTPNGLVVPVIRDADRKGVLEVAKETATLAKKARDGKLTGADMQGGTFTISSLGGIGGTGFTPIINAPEVAILGVSKSTMKPVWDGKAFQPRLMLPLSLSYDHRVIDGASAARFCASLAQTLADLRRALL